MPPSLSWTASVDRRALVAAGHELIEFTTLRRQVVAAARRVDGRRKSIDNPARDWLDRVARADRLAVVGVRIRNLDDLAALHGYVLEPALRSGTALVIESEQRLTRLPPEGYIDPDSAYPYTLERAIHGATRLYRGLSLPEPQGRCRLSRSSSTPSSGVLSTPTTVSSRWSRPRGAARRRS